MIFADLTVLQWTLIGALALIVLGLLICLLSTHARYELLKTVFFWIGLVAAVLGALLALLRPLVWLAKQLSDATGAG